MTESSNELRTILPPDQHLKQRNGTDASLMIRYVDGVGMESSSESPGDRDRKNTGCTEPDSLFNHSSNETETSNTGQLPGPPYRQWLNDRSEGKSKYGNSRPPCFIFFVPICVKWWPGYLESNCLCENLGSIGLLDPEHTSKRRLLLKSGLVSNILGFFLTVYTCFAISKRHNFIQNASFSRAEFKFANGTAVPLSLDIGLTAIAYENLAGTGKNVVVRFDEFCGLIEDGLDRYMHPDHCARCNEISNSLIASLVLGLLSYLPTLTTDVLRMWPNYDVNCQKVFASFFSMFSLGMSIYTWKGYGNGCFDAFYEGDVYFDESMNPVVDPETEGYAMKLTFDWVPGPGIMALTIASLSKIVDIICNLLIPTPSITRDKHEQEAYELMFSHNTAEQLEP